MRPAVIDELLFLANHYIAKDPCGAGTMRRAARMIAGVQKVPCEECRAKYAAGYQAGYNKGVTEWQEGLERDADQPQADSRVRDPSEPSQVEEHVENEDL